MTTHATCGNPACPNLPRLHEAAAVYRAQQATTAQLQEQVSRYKRIGLRRWRQTSAQARAQALYGTQAWSENILLRRALADLQTQIQRKNALLKELRLVLAHPDKWSKGQPATELAHEITVQLNQLRTRLEVQP
jgi:hypothetical protein